MNESKSPSHTPTGIARDGESAIEIMWDDQTSTRWTASELRKACPCATCREKKRGMDEQKVSSGPIGLPVLSAAEAAPLTIESMRPVGTYAYNIAFSDGHNSGIFQFAMLYQGPRPEQTN
tara:strand:- start:983720 stop:984079 length:360 start_codon:yes stop_codon:yes gene_type:complete